MENWNLPAGRLAGAGKLVYTRWTADRASKRSAALFWNQFKPMPQSRQPEAKDHPTIEGKDLTLELKNNELPLYQQVKEAVVSRILSGAWHEGRRVPSENDLVRELGLSRMTAHRALRELTTEGWLERRQGAGTYVAGAKPQSAAMQVCSIREEIEGRGHRYDAEVLLLKEEPARALEGSFLEIEAGAPLFHSLILHRENGTPVQIEERFVNPAMAPDYLKQDFTLITPYDYLISACPLSEAEHTILAVLPDAKLRKLLEMKTGEPCLLLRRRTWSGGHPVTYALLSHPGDRYRLGARFQGQAPG